MKEVGYYNGKIGPLEEMTVPMEDRALYFGDGIYEATCVANRVPFALDDHLDRMYNSLRLLEIPFHMERDQVKAELQKVIDAAEVKAEKTNTLADHSVETIQAAIA